MANLKLIIPIFLIFIFYSISCVKEKIDTKKLDTSLKLDAGLAIPVGYLDLRIGDVIGDSGRLQSNAERILTMYYSDSLTTPPVDSFLRAGVVERTYRLLNETGHPLDLSNGDLDTTLRSLIAFNIELAGIPIMIDSITVRRGEITVSPVSMSSEGEIIHLEFPGITSGSGSLSLPVKDDQNQSIHDLSRYTIGTVKNDDAVNMIGLGISLHIPQQEKVINPGDLLAGFDLRIRIEKWSLISGFRGNVTLRLPLRSFNVTYDRDLPAGDYQFTDPSISVVTKNSFGLPVGLGFRSFSGFTEGSGNVSLTGPGIPLLPQYFNPAYPSVPSPLLSRKDSFEINRNNSTIVNVIAGVTRTFIYQPVIQFRSGDPESSGFISSESSLSALVKLELPFSGYAGNILLQDTTSFNTSVIKFNGAGGIREAMLNIYYENSFPADLLLQLYLADQEMNITDTLFAEPVLIRGASPAEIWQEEPPVHSGDLNIPVSPEILQKPDAIRYLIGQAMMSTSGTRAEVNFFDNQALLLKTGIIVNLQKETDSF